jgi:hypothetical protein
MTSFSQTGVADAFGINGSGGNLKPERCVDEFRERPRSHPAPQHQGLAYVAHRAA